MNVMHAKDKVQVAKNGNFPLTQVRWHNHPNDGVLAHIEPLYFAG